MNTAPHKARHQPTDTLSAESIQTTFRQYDSQIWHTVHTFKRRGQASRHDLEDLYQEASLGFMEFLHKGGRIESSGLPVKNMLHKMCLYVLKDQYMKLPAVHSMSVREKLACLPARTALPDDLSRIPDRAYHETEEMYPMQDSLTRISFTAYMNSLSALEQQIIRMRLDGRSLREIALQLGWTAGRLNKTVARLTGRFKEAQSAGGGQGTQDTATVDPILLTHPEYGRLGVLPSGTGPRFVFRDVCGCLNIVDCDRALLYLPGHYLSTARMLTADGRRREIGVISEPGVYELLHRFSKPASGGFLQWFTKDVLPAALYGNQPCNTDKSFS
jgi:RNA polymerase sigma factor (sigma-70 family)